MARIIDIDSSGRVESVRSEEADRVRKNLQQLAWLLDSSIPIPGTQLTVGVDALVGLFPVIGDLIGVALSSYILSQAARLGAPRSVLTRMASTSVEKKFAIDFEVGRTNVRWLGIYRPCVGGIFGLATFLLLASGILQTQSPPPESEPAVAAGPVALTPKARITSLAKSRAEAPLITPWLTIGLR